jgi:hypothetical protein
MPGSRRLRPLDLELHLIVRNDVRRARAHLGLVKMHNGGAEPLSTACKWVRRYRDEGEAGSSILLCSGDAAGRDATRADRGNHGAQAGCG